MQREWKLFNYYQIKFTIWDAKLNWYLNVYKHIQSVHSRSQIDQDKFKIAKMDLKLGLG